MSDLRKNCLYRGDMLDVASVLPSKSFRLIYLDPPFFTGREQIGAKSDFKYDDRWDGNFDSYLSWMEERLAAVYSLLCDNGSLVLHLDCRATHYARVILDKIFGRDGFVNEIIWHYTGGGRSKWRFSCKHDTLLWYSRSTRPVFNIDAVRMPYKATSGYAKAGIKSRNGRLYMPDPRGTPVDDVWDIPIINPMSAERVGYPTQKPLALLERIIGAMSNSGDLVGDFCCGSGSTIVCAHKMNRQWIGSDISISAVDCVLSRLKLECGVSPEVIVL